MRNRSNIFWGAILVAFGVIFLGTTNDWFEFDVTLREFAKFWPVLIILAGVAVFFNHRKTIYNPTTALLVAFAIPLAIYNGTNRVMDKVENEINEDYNFDWDDENESNEDEDFTFESDSTSSSKFSQSFNVPIQSGVNVAKLEVGGGAAEFFLSEADNQNLFQAETKLIGSKFVLEDERKGDSHEISFKMNSKKGNNNIKLGVGGNDVHLKMSKSPIWDLDLGVGAGQLKFDLSDYKIRDIKMETGAADISLKLGDKLKESKVKVESGAAKIRIQVPKGTACQINMEGALNAKDFDGFSKTNPGMWKTDNFGKAQNTIYIEIESGLSAVSVERY